MLWCCGVLCVVCDVCVHVAVWCCVVLSSSCWRVVVNMWLCWWCVCVCLWGVVWCGVV